jgi:hypothetical protein
MYSLTKLWQITTGHEDNFSEYVRIMCSDTCSNGDIIARKVSSIIWDFKERPPLYKDVKYFQRDKYANNVLEHIFGWFNDYKNKLSPNPYWAM